MGEGPVNGAARMASWRTDGVGGQHFWGRDRKEPGLAGRDVGIRTAVRLTGHWPKAWSAVCGPTPRLPQHQAPRQAGCLRLLVHVFNYRIQST